jgi:hypothetical protein
LRSDDCVVTAIAIDIDCQQGARPDYASFESTPQELSLMIVKLAAVMSKNLKWLFIGVEASGSEKFQYVHS